MDRLFDELLGQTLMGAVSIGIGVYLLANERNRTPANLSLVLFFFIVGFDGPTTNLLAGRVDPDHVGLGERLQVLLDAAAAFCVGPYLLSLVATAKATPSVRRYIRIAVLCSYLIAGTFACLGLLYPATRLNEYSLALGSLDALRHPGFWLFAWSWIVLSVLYLLAWILLSRQELDPGERTRAICFGIAGPLITLATFESPRVAFVCFTACLLVAQFGIIRYLGVQGERAAFLSRFMSSQVAELVRLQGLGAVMKPQELELSVVCIDFRGFTSYTEAIPTQAVIDLISDYHEAIAPVVAEHEGMIKDYAGDGILILVGAPIARPDHAQAALSLARGAMAAAQRVIDRWATGPHPLGIGIGVATGRVTVGAIGDTAQMEYTAVGTAVNVAARLCSTAEDGTILIDEALAKVATSTPRGQVSLKGLSRPTAIFELGSDAEPRAVAGEPLG